MQKVTNLLGYDYALIDVANDTAPYDITVQTQWGSNSADFY